MNVHTPEIDALEYANDGLSAVLRLLKAEARVYHNAKLCGDWRLSEHRLGATCFHVATSGAVLLDVPGHFHGRAETGDLIIFPRELAHNMVSAAPLSGEPRRLDFRAGRDIDGVGLLCGEVSFQHRASQRVLDGLPPVLIVRFDPANYWLRSLLDLIIGENMHGGLASSVLLDKLSELLFAYALRHYIQTRPDQAGPLAIYAQPRLAKAIEAIHQAPEKDWTLSALAKVAAMSRTSFAEAFRAAGGGTPGQYLTWWRMQLAWAALSEGESVAQTAAKVGYRSDAAFSRAFQKCFHLSAGQVRRQGRGGEPPPGQAPAQPDDAAFAGSPQSGANRRDSA